MSIFEYDYNGKSEAALKAALGGKIKAIALVDDVLEVGIEGLGTLRLYDSGQSCCESRYMTFDGDDFGYYVGARLLDVEVREAPEPNDDEEEYPPDCHEVQFLVLKTSKGEIVLSSHNEHNGYYGGFWLEARVE